MKIFFFTILSTFIVFNANSQSSLTLNPIKDNSLYSQSGSTSNGAGDYLFFGRTSSGDLRRAVMAFDVASALQPGDVIVDVFLRVQVSQVPSGAPTAITNIHRVSQDWGEGTSDAPNNEGAGTAATTGDATWTQAFFGGTNPIPWNNAGGDFNSSASATINVSGLGQYTANNPQLTADVQDFLDNPANNFGWIIIGDESVNKSAKRINSRENSTDPVSLEIRFNRAVGLNENLNDLNAIAIVPNPVNNSFELKNVNKIEQIEILDLNGKRRMLLNPEINNHSVSTLDRGIYLLRISSGDKTITRKLIKQ